MPDRKPAPRPEREAVRLRLRYRKTGIVRFVGHLDLVNLFRRAARRAGLPLHYSLGFHPQPSLAFGPPLPLGYEGLCEWLDVGLDVWQDPRDAVQALNGALPEGVSFEAGREVPLSAPALAERIDAGEYRLVWPAPESSPALTEKIGEFLAAEAVPGTQWSKHGPQTVDLRPAVLALQAVEGPGTQVRLLHHAAAPKAAKVPAIVEHLCRGVCEPWQVQVTRTVSGRLQPGGTITIP